jgi:hypothetical protein
MIAALLSLLPAAATAPAASVFPHGIGGFPCVRVPSLLALPPRRGAGVGPESKSAKSSRLLAFAECRSFVGDGCEPKGMWPPPKGGPSVEDRVVCMRVSDTGGESWDPLIANLSQGHGMYPTALYDPVRDQVVLQFSGWPPSAKYNYYSPQPYQLVSTDRGASWTDPVEVLPRVPGIAIFGSSCRGLAVTTGPHRGRLLFAGYNHTVPAPKPPAHANSTTFVWYSDTGGRSWELAPGRVLHMAEPQLAESGGNLLLFGRSNSEQGCDCQARASSTDGGRHWTKAANVTSLPSPKCQGSVALLGGGGLYTGPADPKLRANMTVFRTSNSVGESWTPGKQLGQPGQLAMYSCLAESGGGGGKVGLLWETEVFDGSCVGGACDIVYSALPAKADDGSVAGRGTSRSSRSPPAAAASPAAVPPLTCSADHNPRPWNSSGVEFVAASWSPTCESCHAWGHCNTTGLRKGDYVLNQTFRCTDYDNIVPLAMIGCNYYAKGCKIGGFGAQAAWTVPCALDGNGHGPWPDSPAARCPGWPAQPGLRQQPAGSKFLLLAGANELLRAGPAGGADVLAADNIMPANQTACVGSKQAGPFAGIWWDSNMAEIRAQAVLYFAALKKAGGEVDEVAVDWEGYMAKFSLRGHEPPICPGPASTAASQSCVACARLKWRLMQEDPRWPAALKQLVALGFELNTTAGAGPEEPEYMWAAMKQSLCIEGTPCVRTLGADRNFAVWRDFILAREAQYWVDALEAPARASFPGARLALYSFRRWSKKHCLAPDATGWLNCQAGGGAASLSIDAPNLYGLSFANCSSPSANPSLQLCRYYGPSVAATLHDEFGVWTGFNSTAFGGLKLDLNIVKTSMLAPSADRHGGGGGFQENNTGARDTLPMQSGECSRRGASLARPHQPAALQCPDCPRLLLARHSLPCTMVCIARSACRCALDRVVVGSTALRHVAGEGAAHGARWRAALPLLQRLGAGCWRPASDYGSGRPAVVGAAARAGRDGRLQPAGPAVGSRCCAAVERPVRTDRHGRRGRSPGLATHGGTSADVGWRRCRPAANPHGPGHRRPQCWPVAVSYGGRQDSRRRRLLGTV